MVVFICMYLCHDAHASVHVCSCVWINVGMKLWVHVCAHMCENKRLMSSNFLDSPPHMYWDQTPHLNSELADFISVASQSPPGILPLTPECYDHRQDTHSTSLLVLGSSFSPYTSRANALCIVSSPQSLCFLKLPFLQTLGCLIAVFKTIILNPKRISFSWSKHADSFSLHLCLFILHIKSLLWP